MKLREQSMVQENKSIKESYRSKLSSQSDEVKAFKAELTSDHDKQVAAMKEVINMKEQE